MFAFQTHAPRNRRSVYPYYMFHGALDSLHEPAQPLRRADANVARERYLQAAAEAREARQAYEEAVAEEEARHRRRAALDLERALAQEALRREQEAQHQRRVIALRLAQEEQRRRRQLELQAIAQRQLEVEAAAECRARKVQAVVARRAEAERARRAAVLREREAASATQQPQQQQAAFFLALSAAIEAFVSGLEEPTATRPSHRQLGRVTPEPPRAATSKSTYAVPVRTAAPEPNKPVSIPIVERPATIPTSSKGKRASSPSPSSSVVVPHDADAPTALALIESALDARLADFVFPTAPDFASPTPTSPPSDAALTPALAYSPTNAPLHAHMHALGRLLAALDAVDSNGDDAVRAARKRVVLRVEAALDDVDSRVKDAWAAQRRALGTKKAVRFAVDGERTQEQQHALDTPAPAVPADVHTAAATVESLLAADSSARAVDELHPAVAIDDKSADDSQATSALHEASPAGADGLQGYDIEPIVASIEDGTHAQVLEDPSTPALRTDAVAVELVDVAISEAQDSAASSDAAHAESTLGEATIAAAGAADVAPNLGNIVAHDEESLASATTEGTTVTRTTAPAAGEDATGEVDAHDAAAAAADVLSDEDTVSSVSSHSDEESQAGEGRAAAEEGFELVY